MYLFEAIFVNMDTNEEFTRKIEIESQLLDSEKDVYVLAMERAHNMTEQDEFLWKVIFVAC